MSHPTKLMFPCPHCGEAVSVFYQKTEKTKTTEVSKSTKKAGRDADLLLDIYARMDNPSDPFQADQIPVQWYSSVFNGEKPESQFGLWLYHQSRKQQSAGTISVVRMPDGTFGFNDKKKSYMLVVATENSDR